MPNVKQDESSLIFMKDVVTYFMDFLESDFHKHRLPRRNTKLRSNENLLVGINLQKYPSFNKLVSRLIGKNFSKDILSRINKGKYRTSLPSNLLDLISVHIGKITHSQIDSLAEQIAAELESAGLLHAKEYDVALTTSVEAAAKIIQSELVHPFVESINMPLQNLDLGDEGDVYLIEDELTAVLLRLLENKISEVLNLQIANVNVELAEELKAVFDLDDVKLNITTFFENLQVADLFLEMSEMDRNKSILDKHEFYLYFGEISYNNTRYPIFYIPLVVSIDGNSVDLEFDSQIYINKKALEYIVQERNKQDGTRGNLQKISDRIIYRSQQQEEILRVISDVINEISNFFQLAGMVDFSSGEPTSAHSASIRLANNCYICLFDKSDEALVNDYEELLQQLNQGGGELSEVFHQLVDDFVEKNPIPFNPEIEDTWDDASPNDKLVYTSAIPLNSEQQQILSAVRKNGCKYIVIEGPPGTGKSHTITAIVFDAILKNQTVLVLSDKKEALDVVEDKITQTMNKVRFDKNFQNPILRLGKTGNTYNSILSRSAIDRIKDHHRAVKNGYDDLTESIAKSNNSIKEDLEAEILAYGHLDLREISEFFDLDLHFDGQDFAYDIAELSEHDEAVIEFADLRASLQQIKQTLDSNQAGELFEALQVNPREFLTIRDFEDFVQFLIRALDSVEKIKISFANKIDAIRRFSYFRAEDLPKLQRYIEQYAQVKKMPIVGFFFSRGRLEILNGEFARDFPSSDITTPHLELQLLKDAQDVIASASAYGSDPTSNTGVSGGGKLDIVSLVHRLITDDNFAQKTGDFAKLDAVLKSSNSFIERYPTTAAKAGIKSEEFHAFLNNMATELTGAEFDKQLRHLTLRNKLDKEFNDIPEVNFAARMKQMEELVTTQVTYLLDGRLIDFSEYHRADAQTLRGIIRSKQRFPKDEFGKLKEAFPCILAGIRDYAEYIPLESELFDLVIIDEASQVSVAQAFPALIRAKKVVILGDKKQFSNIKAAQARSDTNREYLTLLASSFRNNVSTETAKQVRLTKFNIKTSILEFFEFISNFNIQLLKHFRGYKELISYSNEYFYNHSLQVMKIRGKPIDEVIKFSLVDSIDEDHLYPNTNIKEAEFIISELYSLFESGIELSVGIITPHTNQQKLLVEMISKTSEWKYYLDQLQLKIMTFDTCQGEERDVVFYSMVASPHSDKLWGVFIKDLAKVDIEEDGQIKAQRLNVGFSRAKERIHFVLSKPIGEFSGSIGDAIRHYQSALEGAKKERSVFTVDPNSKMEPEVMNWFYQTSFWRGHKDRIEFIPQFEIGEYLKQLDRTYSHPLYKVDFLLIYRDESLLEHKIIIEYDGFREHFRELQEVNQYNYREYYTEEDGYRQKVLESYGYKFLRINKFNIGELPVATLDERIRRLIENAKHAEPVLTTIQKTVEGLQSGGMKECPKCEGVKPMSSFVDPSLISGIGKICNDCKAPKVTIRRSLTQIRTTPTSTASACPKCGSRMVLRKGRIGRFYGCSQFPYCRGTRGA